MAQGCSSMIHLVNNSLMEVIAINHEVVDVLPFKKLGKTKNNSRFYNVAQKWNFNVIQE